MNFKTGAAAILLIMGTAAQQVAASAKATLSESSFDFGIAPQNAKLSHIFWIHSTGDQELKIINVSPGCGCTQAPLDNNILPVGDSTRLEVIFNTGAYVGEVTKHPSFRSNSDSANTPLVFTTDITLQPDSTKPIRIKPFRFDLTPVGEGKTVEFTITNVSDKEVKLRMISVPTDLLDVRLPASIAAGQQETGTIALKSKAFEGTIEKSFTFEADNGQVVRFSVPVARLAVSAASRVIVSDPKVKK